MADELDLLVIDETSTVGLNLQLGFRGHDYKCSITHFYAQGGANAQTSLKHAQVIRELSARDKNPPSVILWSIANEPDSVYEVAYEYFEPLAKLARSLAPSRPVCYVNDANGYAETEKLAGLFDVVCLNRYFGWYTETFDLALATAICLYPALPS